MAPVYFVFCTRKTKSFTRERQCSLGSREVKDSFVGVSSSTATTSPPFFLSSPHNLVNRVGQSSRVLSLLRTLRRKGSSAARQQHTQSSSSFLFRLFACSFSVSAFNSLSAMRGSDQQTHTGWRSDWLSADCLSSCPPQTDWLCLPTFWPRLLFYKIIIIIIFVSPYFRLSSKRREIVWQASSQFSSFQLFNA